MAKFVRHNPCPKCNSRDNLGVYNDGSEWCFGCGYYKRPFRTLVNSRKQQEKEANSDVVDHFRNNCTTSIAKKPLTWLRQYGITDSEIEHYKIVYNNEEELLILGGQGRYFGPNPNHPKIITLGNGPEEVGRSTEIGIFVEDFISAIKVGRSFTALPVYGSHIAASALKRAIERFFWVGIWLDSDKASEAARIAQKGRLLGGEQVFRVNTRLDPKWYSTSEINELVNSIIKSKT